MRSIHLCIFVLAFVAFSCQDDQRALVVGKIQSASKLATTEFTVDKIVHGTKTKKLAWVVKLNEARFLAYSQAKIKAGIDLNKLKAEDIKIKGKCIDIELPPVEVIIFSYPPDNFRVDEEISDYNKLLNKISLEDQEEFFQDAEMDIRNNLEYMGIVETTQQHTRTLLTGLFKSLGYQEIYISFKSDRLIIDKVEITQE
ncbi:MAG: DUF4230 domain-containing protein [Bacteroidales bacterium]|nr:DUF4230 domain-containing protein [Bacteroidales bacterium]MCF8458435.1 DUF4230 domain-containing protein [Bacteroidales bacterium]